MELKDLEKNKSIINIKHGCVEDVKDFCLMKSDSGEWVDGVLYYGKDRFTGEYKLFCKRRDDVLLEFEKCKTWEEWICDVISQLQCEMSEAQANDTPFNCFPFSRENIIDSINYFEDCWRSGMSPYKALTMFKCKDGEKKHTDS